MSPAPLPIVSSCDTDDYEAECPICLEPLSFSFCLPGEKPHIVPECGHALHEACFVAVYGPAPGSRNGSNLPRKNNLGVCGVCQRPMKVAEGDGRKSNRSSTASTTAYNNSSSRPSTATAHVSQNLSDCSDVTVTSTNKYNQPYRPPSDGSASSAPYTYNPTSALDSAFAAITEDLRNRIINWKGHPLSELGSLQLYDLLSVRRGSLVREFHVYLFREAIICAIEEKKWSLGRLLRSVTADTASLLQQSKGVLRLKGRFYIRHIKQVTETSIAGELSLTIDMEDEHLESFILIFRDRSSLETWRNVISDLVARTRGPSKQEC